MSRPDVSPSAGVSFLGTALDPMILGLEILHIGAASKQCRYYSPVIEGSPAVTIYYFAAYTSKGKGHEPNASFKRTDLAKKIALGISCFFSTSFAEYVSWA